MKRTMAKTEKMSETHRSKFLKCVFDILEYQNVRFAREYRSGLKRGTISTLADETVLIQTYLCPTWC